MIQLLERFSYYICIIKTVDKVVDSKEEKDRIKAKIQEQALAELAFTVANIILLKQKVKVGLLVLGVHYL